MTYLFIAIFLSSIIPVIFKITEDKNLNRYGVTLFNYTAAVIISFFMSKRQNLFSYLTIENLDKFLSELPSVVFNNQAVFSKGGSAVWAVVVGLILGVTFCLAFVQYQKSIKNNGISLSNTFLKLSVLVPMIISLVLWKEFPTNFQWIGIILSFSAIIISNVSFKKDTIKDIRLNLILLLIYGGFAEFSTKLFQKYALIEFKNLLLLSIFTSALITSLLVVVISKKRFGKKEIAAGILVGIPNLFTSYFMVLAFSKLNTSTAVMLNSSGTIVLVLLYGKFFFKEKLKKKEKIAVFLTILAMLAINYKP
jgi:drug/metabolite transporter (DMT)-like permease